MVGPKSCPFTAVSGACRMSRAWRYLDGTLNQVTTSFYRAGRGNLWLVGQIRSDLGSETPVCGDDAFLIPRYPTGQAGNASRSMS